MSQIDASFDFETEGLLSGAFAKCAMGIGPASTRLLDVTRQYAIS